MALLALFGVLFLLPSGRGLEDGDTYWHIAAGKWIISHGMVPSGDPFSYSMPGAAWTTQEWLSQVIMSVVYRAGGWAAMQVLGAACFAITLAQLTRFLLQRLEPVHALLFVGFAAGMMLTHFLVRPHVLVWPLFAVWFGALIDASESRRGPSWWLLLVMLLWANLHGDFTLGLLLAGGIAIDAIIVRPADERRLAAKRWIGFVALAVLVSALTPNGWQGLWFTVEVMRQEFALAVVGEWASLDFHKIQVFEVWLLFFLAIACTGRLRLPLMRLLMVLGLVHLALRSNRSVSTLGLVSPFLMAGPISCLWYGQGAVSGGNAERLDRWFRALARPASALTVTVALAVSIVLVSSVVPSRTPVPAANMTPAAALKAAQAAGVKGAILNGYGFGGYLIFQEVKVFIDSRSDMYGDPFMKRYVQALHSNEAKTLISLINDYGIGWTLLPPETTAIMFLDRMAGWRRVYADDIAVVHMRVTDAPAR